MKTTHTPTSLFRRALLPTIALIVLAALIVCTTPVTQAIAGRLGIEPAQMKPGQIASNILSYAPASIRKVLGVRMPPARTASPAASANAPVMLSGFTKTASPASGSTVAAGSTITYTVTVTNDDLFDDL